MLTKSIDGIEELVNSIINDESNLGVSEDLLRIKNYIEYNKIADLMEKDNVYFPDSNIFINFDKYIKLKNDIETYEVINILEDRIIPRFKARGFDQFTLPCYLFNYDALKYLQDDGFIITEFIKVEFNINNYPQIVFEDNDFLNQYNCFIIEEKK